jgi:glycosyltransferase involved in cell wall biosynthesis
MANAVSRLLNDSALASHLSSNARQKAENLDWSRILPQWEAVITTALKENLNG